MAYFSAVYFNGTYFSTTEGATGSGALQPAAVKILGSGSVEVIVTSTSGAVTVAKTWLAGVGVHNPSVYSTGSGAISPSAKCQGQGQEQANGLAGSSASAAVVSLGGVGAMAGLPPNVEPPQPPVDWRYGLSLITTWGPIVRDIIGEVVGIRFETTGPGGFASCSWQMPQSAYRLSRLEIGALVHLRHSGHELWEGSVLATEPTYGDEQYVTVECGGYFAIAQARKDYCKGWLDCDLGEWYEDEANDQAYQMSNEGRVWISAEDGTFSANDYAQWIYWVHRGLDTSQDILGWLVDYNVNVDAADWYARWYESTDPYAGTWTAIGSNGGTWPAAGFTNQTASGSNLTFTASAGTKAIACRLYCTSAKSNAGNRYIELKDVRVAIGSGYEDIDSAMQEIADDLVNTFDTESISGPLQMMVRPFVSRAEALVQIAELASEPIDWGFWDNATFRCKPRTATPDANIHYVVDSTQAGLLGWDVQQETEEKAEYVCVLYGSKYTGSETYPAGTVRATYRPTTPGTSTAQCHILDLSDQIMDVSEAANAGDQYLAWSQTTEFSGRIDLAGEIRTVNGVRKPAIYIRAGDYIENVDVRGHTPLYITATSCDLEQGTVTVDVGETKRDFVQQVAKRIHHVAAGPKGRYVRGPRR